MATSESDPDFESADEELSRSAPIKRQIQGNYWVPPSTVDSESDDDTEYVQHTPYVSSDWQRRPQVYRINASPVVTTGQTPSIDKTKDVDNTVKVETDKRAAISKCTEKTSDNKETECSQIKSEKSLASVASTKDTEPVVDKIENTESNDAKLKIEAKDIENVSKTVQQDVPRRLTARRLATDSKETDLVHGPDVATDGTAMEPKDKSLAKCLDESSMSTDEESQEKFKVQSTDNQSMSNDLSEMDMPEELKSDKKFKELFEPEGWEGLGDFELPDELTEEELPALGKVSVASKEPEGSLGMWRNSWENWGVTSLINSATASVSTLTSHVSQGLTLLEGTIGGMQDSIEPSEVNDEVNQDGSDDAEPKVEEQENQSYSSFGFGNLLLGVSSITKLVESTGSKVMTGGLDTLEAIGKKTMEVLQDGDPGLKKKRAFFMNDTDKPILSQILREAKEKAENKEKTLEERELARKIHFESLFDDYQGLVHLEALEMLSKQSNIKIQQHLIELSTNDLISVQETLEEIKELCELDGCDDDEDNENKNDGDLKNKLMNACHDLGVNIAYQKLHDICTETESYLALTHTNQEIFQNAISTVAQFTAASVETFHKTAELLLIKERRSTVNEADALVQLTNILSGQISALANSFCNTLNQLAETAEKPGEINANITTIFLEAANANSYVQDAFRLLIPILQVGAI